VNDSNWLTQARKGLLELCVLNLLTQETMYGYQIVKRLTEVPGIVITEGTIYPLLSRIKKEGLIESIFVESQFGPMRRTYKLTETGKKRMLEMNDAWLEMSKSVSKIISKSTI
jgi:PadR family transcriptional regulator, regulatory protein PadR